MLKLSKLLGVVAITLLINGCCSTDYSPTIRKVASPMLVELEKFYKTNKRHPNIKERDVLLLKTGCEKVVGNVCFRDGDEILIKESYIDSPNEYTMLIKYKKSYCRIVIYNSGDILKPACKNIPCIRWDH